MYVHQDYPRWRYHATKEAVIVKDPEADAALGEGWADTPAAFDHPPTEAPSDAVRPQEPADQPAEAIRIPAAAAKPAVRGGRKAGTAGK